MPEQTSDTNLENTIDPKELNGVPLVPEEDQKIQAHSQTLATSSPTTNLEEGLGFPCDKCDKSFPNEKKAKDLHMQKVHNIKTLQSTPGPVYRNTEKDNRTRPTTNCTSCSYICKTKVGMTKHIDLFHKSKKEIAKQAPMKRQLTSFTCPKCNSTFDNKYRMQYHLKSQHEGKHTLSPKRKVAKQSQDNDATIKENDKVEDNKQGEMVQVERKEMEDLHDKLTRLGKENETLKGTIREWITKTENMSDEIKKSVDRNKDISKELKELKVVVNTPVLGLAVPVRNSESQLGYDCYLCDQKAMNQSGMYNHLKHMHNVNRGFDTIPVEEDNEDIEKRSVVTTQKTTTDTITNNAKSTITTDSSEALLEFAHYCDKCKQGFTHKGNLHKHKREHDEGTQSISIAPIVEKARQPHNMHRNFKFSGIITCNICEAVFLSQPLLKEHIDKSHKDSPETEINANEKTQSQSKPIQKTIQFHCALSNETSGILCSFQCNSKEELDKHIKHGHKSFPCSDRDCSVECDSLDNLANHVSTLHARKHLYMTADIICNICEMKFQTKSELIDHIKIHKSYKLCKNYAMNNCGPQIEC